VKADLQQVQTGDYLLRAGRICRELGTIIFTSALQGSASELTSIRQPHRRHSSVVSIVRIAQLLGHVAEMRTDKRPADKVRGQL